MGRLGNPIDDYSKLSTYKPPFHVLEKDRSELERFIENTQDKVRSLGWMQLYERMRYLRPAQELYIDIGLDDPGVYKLRDLVTKFIHRELDIYLDYDIDILTFSEDWGTQTSLQISPSSWRRIFKPTYKELFDRIHKAGKMVEFHSCGYIMEIIPDLVELGVEILHCQVSIMDMDELFDSFDRKICIKADFNRQKLPFESPKWVYDEVHRIYDALGRNQPGGLYLFAEVAGATPIANMQAFVDAVNDIRREQTEG